jgi:hypothetical protein
MRKRSGAIFAVFFTAAIAVIFVYFWPYLSTENIWPLSAVTSAVKQAQQSAAEREASSGAVSQASALVKSDSALGDEWGESGLNGIKVYQYGKTLLRSDEEKAVYDKIAAAVRGDVETLAFDSSLEPAAMKRIYKYFAGDHAEAFYLSGAEINYSYKNSGGKKIYIGSKFKFSYRYTKAERDKMRAAIDEKALRLIAAANGKTDEAAKERAVHDALVGSVKYQQQAVGNPDKYPESFTVYGAVCGGSAVCDGYARAMKLLLDGCGIKSLYVTGTVTDLDGGGPHAWNIVNVSGRWYYVDATFDDPTFVDAGGSSIDKNIVDHSFFNFTTERRDLEN